jgi:hypothetical protein
LEETKIHILAPELDIDGIYLGVDPEQENVNPYDFAGTASQMNSVEGPPGLEMRTGLSRSIKEAVKLPKGTPITEADFERLKTRMIAGVLRFAYQDNEFRNNTSVVLLIEWKGRRLLFTGDAEWEREYEPGTPSSSWNVMWSKRWQRLRQPLDFLKVGHHGSVNATPWEIEAGYQEPASILNSILPKIRKAKAKAVISTMRKSYRSIPSAGVIKELGSRVSNTRDYDRELSEIQKNKLPNAAKEAETLVYRQPRRTDFEELITGKIYTPITIRPA